MKLRQPLGPVFFCVSAIAGVACFSSGPFVRVSAAFSGSVALIIGLHDDDSDSQ